MLFFLNQYFADYSEFIVDVDTNQCFLLILKNATKSQKRLSEKYPKKFHYYKGSAGIQFLREKAIKEITVFLREPMGRFSSGLASKSIRY